MTTLLKPDICVIGGGAGGLGVAAAAAGLGAPVVLVDKGRMGANRLDRGCVPATALIAAANRAHAMRHAKAFGIRDVEPEIDFGRVNRHVRSVTAAIATDASPERFTALGVRVIEAEARFIDRRTVAAGDFEIRARRFVIATGSSTAVPAIPGLDEVDYHTSETIFGQTRKPGHLLVMGGGPTGLELAQAHARLGCAVTVVEAATALGGEDPELAAIVVATLREEGVRVLEGTRIERVERRGKAGLRLHVWDADRTETIDGTHLLVAAGRAPNTGGLGLEAAGIAFDGKGIKVSDTLRTTNRRAYAVGDVAGGPQFTHVAAYHASLVLRPLFFRRSARADHSLVPRVTFTDPELAHVGIGEQEAATRHRGIRILRWPFSENDRARAERRTGGHVKMVTDRRGTILGVTILGAGAGEMIGLWELVIARKMGVRDVEAHMPPYPTMGEIGKRAAMTYFQDFGRRAPVRRVVRMLRMLG